METAKLIIKDGTDLDKMYIRSYDSHPSVKDELNKCYLWKITKITYLTNDLEIYFEYLENYNLQWVCTNMLDDLYKILK